MLNVTPLLSINLSMQTSWGPELWPWTTLVSSPEAGRTCLLAQPPHGVSQICTLKTKHMQKIFSTYLNKHTQIYTWQRLDTRKAKLKKKCVNSYLRNTDIYRRHIHRHRNPHACLKPCLSIVPLEDCASFHWRCYGLLSARPFHGWLP